VSKIEATHNFAIELRIFSELGQNLGKLGKTLDVLGYADPISR